MGHFCRMPSGETSNLALTVKAYLLSLQETLDVKVLSRIKDWGGRWKRNTYADLKPKDLWVVEYLYFQRNVVLV